eukprot:scaffold66373_cov17-Tisochrysis_lutea.AAC.1
MFVYLPAGAQEPHSTGAAHQEAVRGCPEGSRPSDLGPLLVSVCLTRCLSSEVPFPDHLKQCLTQPAS